MTSESEAASQEFLSPRRRHERIRLGPCTWHKGEQALYFSGRSAVTQMVCVTPEDLAALRETLAGKPGDPQ